MTRRYKLIVGDGKVELIRKGWPLSAPEHPVESSHTRITGFIRDHIAPSTIPQTRPKQVQLIRRAVRQWPKNGKALLPETLQEYYGVALTDEEGARREYAISIDINEARFVFQIIAGVIPGAIERLPPAGSFALDAPKTSGALAVDEPEST